jgi:hypothetical protein
LTFDDLEEGTTYFIFARNIGDNNTQVGAAGLILTVETNKDSGLPIGAIVGIAIGAVALIGLALFVFKFVIKKRTSAD